MNAYVEVATASMVADTAETKVITKVLAFVKAAIVKVAASTKRLKMLRYSIEKVAPNTYLGGTA